MYRPASAVDAISPAIQHTKRMLFNPFDLGRWFILGFLSFLQVLGEGGGSSGFHWPGGDRSDETQQVLRETIGWVGMHWTLVAVLGFFGIFFLLAVGVLFLWLSSRATFCYIDCAATDRAEVVRPWREHRQVADSFFFWRLIFALCVLGVMVVLLVPIGFSIWNIVESGEHFSLARTLFGSSIVVILLPILVLFLIGVLIVRVLLTDFVAPVQYLQRVKCAVAVRTVMTMIRENFGAFVLYIVMRVLISIVIGCAVLLAGCATCCIGFCCMAIPVIGTTILQPVYMFKRSFSLYFLSGFGPGFDVFAPEAPGGGLGPRGDYGGGFTGAGGGFSAPGGGSFGGPAGPGETGGPFGEAQGGPAAFSADPSAGLSSAQDPPADEDPFEPRIPRP